MDSLSFLTENEVRSIQQQFGTPLFVYDQATLESQADAVLAFPNAYGLTARFAMKALPTAAVIQTLTARGLHIDASSGFEAQRALRVGVPASHIQITAQEIPVNLKELIDAGVLYNACSINQLNAYGELFPGAEVSVRINPGLGSGHSNRTNVGGPSASCGIWHEHIPEVLAVAERHNLRITGMHTHIGSGSDPHAWVQCATLSLGIVAQFPDVTTLSLGGGFKVARMDHEVSADVQAIGTKIKEEFKAFAAEHGRELHLEVEPGTFLVANAGVLLSTIMDVVDTGIDGYNFIKLNAGMTEILRPSMYGAQHPLVLVPQDEETRQEKDYLVVGHCCESGDVLTPEPGNPEGLLPRNFPEAKVGDVLVIEGAGAYCSGMPAKNYNAFPECAEVLRGRHGVMTLIRKRQEPEQIWQNEIVL